MVNENLKRLFSGLFLVAGCAWGASVAPLYFTSLGNSADDRAEEQQAYWESLMKYKVWGTHSLTYSNGNISISDNTGYNGTADGDFIVNFQHHHIGGPTLVGGNFKFNNGGYDTLTTGPVRVLGDMQVTLQDDNVFEGDYCVKGNIRGQYEGNKNLWAEGVRKSGGSIYEKMNYDQCPESVPEVDAHLNVPVLPQDSVWVASTWSDESIEMTSCSPDEVLYIHVPPDSVVTNEFGTFDKYVDHIKISCTNHKKMYFLMPPGGRLTRIFSKNGFDFSNSVSDMRIQVVYASETTKFDKTKMEWDLSDSANFSYLTNKEYSGNLLFYTPQPILWNYWVDANFQGSWITADSFHVAGHFKLAGQVVAENLYFDADVQGDFRYVPFDPPILDIDPTAMGAGTFIENDRPQQVQITLSDAPTTAVEFNYCFALSNLADSNAVHLANKADFITAGMPLCTVKSNGTVVGDSGLVTFKAGHKLPTSPVMVTPKKDDLIEGDETFKLYVFNMSGAVLKGNKRTGYFTLKIKDVDFNTPPYFDKTAYSFNEDENSPIGDSVGIVHASDKQKGDIPYYYIASGDSALFTMDSISGKITVKKNALDYESKDTTFTLFIYASDGLLNSDTIPVTIHIKDVNEAPVAPDTTFKIAEDAKKGTVVGTVLASDPDSLHIAEFGKLKYQLVTKTTVFAVDSLSGKLILTDTLDYETTKSYTVYVRVSDGKLADTAKVIVNVLNVNEAPVVKNTTVMIDEECKGCAASNNVPASDPDGDKLKYEVLKDTSGLFKIDSTIGRIALKKDAKLDYEKDSVYQISVVVSDPGGLKDTALVTIKVRNLPEKVEITYAESGDSSWKKPDTIYTNNPKTYIKWTTPVGEKDSTVIAKEGKNTVKVSYQDGSATLVIILSTKIPKVTVTASNDTTGAPSGVTIVEEKEAGDTASYVRSKNALITVTVTDSSGEKPVTKKNSFKVALDTATVSKSQISAMEKTVGKVNVADESELSSKVKVTHSVVGENKIRVSYYDTTAAGTVVEVAYYTDSKGKRLADKNGEEYYEISSTVKNAEGKSVTLTYTVDALGTVKQDENGKTLYQVSYTNAVKAADGVVYDVKISYTMNASGEKSKDADGNMIYDVAYTFTDSYGNSATASTVIIVDPVPPVVKIISPENMASLSNVSVSVKWTVNDIEQDTLNFQGLNDGKNLIIRTYRDKAGNEASDTVIVILKAGKLVKVKMEEPLVNPDSKRVEKFTAASNSKPGTTYALSVMNAKTGKEVETQAGSASGLDKGSFKEPYSGLSGKHLGSTLHITAQAPAVDQTGTSSSLGSILENGYVSLDSGGGWNRKKIPVDEFLENNCSADFRNAYDSLGAAASLYTTKIKLKIWFFTTLGEFVSEYGFTQDIYTENVDESGGIQLFFELKPDEDGFLRSADGRKLATGPYIYKSEVKIRSELQCDLPDRKKGYIRKDDDDILTRWGYRRPNN